MSRKKPDYVLGLMDKFSGEKTYRAGAAWKNDDGTISIKLEPFVMIPLDRKGLVITLFMNDKDWS